MKYIAIEVEKTGEPAALKESDNVRKPSSISLSEKLRPLVKKEGESEVTNACPETQAFLSARKHFSL